MPPKGDPRVFSEGLRAAVLRPYRSMIEALGLAREEPDLTPLEDPE